ncbi:hypothetical protein BsWGS_28075 [Bradybaena similaris]
MREQTRSDCKPWHKAGWESRQDQIANPDAKLHGRADEVRLQTLAQSCMGEQTRSDCKPWRKAGWESRQDQIANPDAKLHGRADEVRLQTLAQSCMGEQTRSDCKPWHKAGLRELTRSDCVIPGFVSATLQRPVLAS